MTYIVYSKRVDGKFLGPGGSSVPTGQAILTGLLEACFEICQDIKARDAEEDVSPPLKPIWERLTEMKAQLERLREFLFSSGYLHLVDMGMLLIGRVGLTHRWTLRETDLYKYVHVKLRIGQY